MATLAVKGDTMVVVMRYILHLDNIISFCSWGLQYIFSMFEMKGEKI